MKRILIICVSLLAVLVLQAQTVPTGSKWISGSGLFEATLIGSTIRMYSMNEGEETVFALVPVDDEGRSFTIRADEEFKYAYYPFGATARYAKEEGMEVLMVYNDANQLTTVLIQSDEDFRDYSLQNRIAEISGQYLQQPTPGVLIDATHLTIGSEVVAYEVVSFNDFATPFIDVKGGSWRGLWEMVPTRDGWKLYEAAMGDYGYPERQKGGRKKVLQWDDPSCSRWDFASTRVLTRSVLSDFKKPSLRLMRNAILARHGYVFSSPDLQQYFNSEPWYQPRESNDGVRLSFIEQLNVSLIKYFEAQSDQDEMAREE